MRNRNLNTELPRGDIGEAILIMAVLIGLTVFTLMGCATAPSRPMSKPLIMPVMPTHARLGGTTVDHNSLSTQWMSVPVKACIPVGGQPVGQNSFTDWKNSGAPIHVTQRWVWIGAASPGGSTLGGRLDAPYMLQDITTGAILAWSSADRYAETSGLGDVLDAISFAPYYITVATGDTVRFTVGCAGPYPPDIFPVSVQGLAVMEYVQ